MPESPKIAQLQRRLSLSWLVMLVLLAILVFPVVRQWLSPGVTGNPRPVTARGELANFEKTTVELFVTASPSVVYINTRAQVSSRWSRRVFEVEAGTGSGFVWDKDGHIVTNFHVIQGASSAQVVFDDQSAWEATLVGSSSDHDLAVLRIRASSDQLQPVLIGESHNLVVGQSVFAIGNPFGLHQTLTTGVVSAKSRAIQGPSGRTIDDVIQIDAAINPGNSGGPLLDSASRLVGVNTAIYSPSGASAGIGFSIPVDTVNRVVPQIIFSGEYEPPRLGIRIDEALNEIVAARLGIEGVVIVGVVPGGPAQQAGLVAASEARDGSLVLGDVIRKIDSSEVLNLNELLTVLERHKRGDTVLLTVAFEGHERTVQVTLE